MYVPKKLHIRLVTLAFLTLSVSAIPAAAATFTVTNVNNTGPGSLRQAVLDANAAAGSDEIVFGALFNAPQAITLTTGALILTTNITIIGSGANLLTVSGGGSSRIFTTTFDPVIAISGMTITQGNGTGGGISAGLGGAIFNEGIMTLTNCVITGNTSTGDGGAIFSSETGDSLTVINCVLSNNIANFDSIGTGRGGAIYSQNGTTLTLTNSIISGNSTRMFGDGGGIYVLGATLNMSGSAVTGNSTNSTVVIGNSSSNGGGIFTSNSVANITNSTISGNIAAVNGGGIFTTQTTGSVTNTTISGNSAGQDGGGMYAGGTSTSPGIASSTIASNTANRDGGGVFHLPQSNPNSIRNTILANNSDDGTAPDFRGAFGSMGYNLIESTVGTTITGMTIGNQTGVDPNLGPLADNGGNTLTHALLTGSPAIDRGGGFGLTMDQRTWTRPVDYPLIANATGGDGSDIGAFEVQPSVSGRVTTPTGLGLRNAIVALTDSQGVRRTATTSSFGIYNFENIRSSETYIIGVSSKRYRFAARNLFIDDNLANVNFVGLE